MQSTVCGKVGSLSIKNIPTPIIATRKMSFRVQYCLIWILDLFTAALT